MGALLARLSERDLRAALRALQLLADQSANSARTVQKHLEHIFQKLDVETRTAAPIRALAAIDQETSANRSGLPQ
jgi:DNA-binding NarL/FixJ family response regulator